MCIRDRENAGQTSATDEYNRMDMCMLAPTLVENAGLPLTPYYQYPVSYTHLDVYKRQTLVYGALGGQAGAGAMLDVLTGKVNPSGKLAETWVNAYADTDVYKRQV